MSDNKLTALDVLFGEIKETNNDEKDKVMKASTKSLVPFNKHPFKLYTGRKFDEMVRSVKEFGILQPIIVRAYISDSVQFKDYNIETNKFEILAGHNRWNAAIAAGLEEVPIVIMKDLSDEEAMLVVIETNLLQRSFTDLSYSERALVIDEHYKSLKSQGRRTDIINQVKELLESNRGDEEETCGHDVHKSNSRDQVGEEYNLDGRTIARYIRINMLCNEMKKFIDDKMISFTAGVQLSHLTEENQLYLIDILDNSKIKITPDIASALREAEEAGKLDEAAIKKILVESNVKQEKSGFKAVKVKPNIVKKYFNNNQSAEEVESIIDKALELYFSQNK